MLNGITIFDTGEIRNNFHMPLDKESELTDCIGRLNSPGKTFYMKSIQSTKFSFSLSLLAVLRQLVVSSEKQRVITGGLGEWVIAL